MINNSKRLTNDALELVTKTLYGRIDKLENTIAQYDNSMYLAKDKIKLLEQKQDSDLKKQLAGKKKFLKQINSFEKRLLQAKGFIVRLCGKKVKNKKRFKQIFR
jgi:ABC-type Fe2+-enterobactin transport system substrate-binding protein